MLTIMTIIVVVHDNYSYDDYESNFQLNCLKTVFESPNIHQTKHSTKIYSNRTKTNVLQFSYK